jgi:hypothetical protein
VTRFRTSDTKSLLPLPLTPLHEGERDEGRASPHAETSNEIPMPRLLAHHPGLKLTEK